ncbi:Oxidoreductase molybdopterin binding domain-containing protein [Halogranum amylolyticum]|uniref:Oxidoreductase molybdopterin binding domain-containing protein n=1 Tax=Halogranum amylolyticum TaxID=660520 RepID=A0A1H8PQV4_9EURY|nr:molybdopterin-dependent oxidoreductase [Halogranum amylolyticum]SEO44054.1 Oxidoreductase molybdopterin binding domain-containing protein [Halogranum amylolyticum]
MTNRLRRWLAGATPSARLVDWTLLVLAGFLVGSGLLSLTVGDPSGAVVFWAHGVAGVALVAVVGVKLWRVRDRLTDRRLRTRATWLSVGLTVVTVGALATGLFWVFGGDFRLLFWGALNVHILFGLLVVPLLLAHLWTRRALPGFRRPRRSDVDGRRDVLRYTGLLVGGALLWRGQQAVNRAFETAGATRRFTGSKPVEGSAFPVTSWVADDPDPVDREAWRLRVDGLVADPLELGVEKLDGGSERRALLDCTSGWYTVQNWRGVRVGDLLAEAGVDETGRWVRFRSVTGYRWSLPLAEARDALLATHVAGERLSHGHGAPLRLVAPGRRGFQWVKWVEAVEVRDRRDPAQWIATLVSGFD